MEDFNLRKYLKENKQPIQEIDAPHDIIQNTLKQLAGYWPTDIKNNLDKLGAEGFKKQLDDLKPYVDQYFANLVKEDSRMSTKGMLDYLRNIDMETADVEELEKVHTSLVDVNYHAEASALSFFIDALKDHDPAIQGYYKELIKTIG